MASATLLRSSGSMATGSTAPAWISGMCRREIRARVLALISRLHIPLIQAGAVLPVAIDPLDRSKVALAIYDDPP